MAPTAQKTPKAGHSIDLNTGHEKSLRPLPDDPNAGRSKPGQKVMLPTCFGLAANDWRDSDNRRGTQH